ncbi:hypothetical protein ACFOGI_05205 [Virgibacillus xinjiangensis]|uniref:Uncharacterized protein n=1 Tax=Virgibacillus xinjiangensis TaxID=393090 RepID=A0ABV7CTI9_9BACI
MESAGGAGNPREVRGIGRRARKSAGGERNQQDAREIRGRRV